MDLHKVLRELYEEKKRLEEVIASLESLQKAEASQGGGAGDDTKRRGRKSMGPEERVKVSQRMKKYWEGRKAAKPKDA